MNELFVKSHVARDLLQTAGLFADVPKAIWEYVVNGLEYIDAGTNPVVKVVVERAKRRVTVTDNGRGMDFQGLQNYFILHGENLDRKAGRPGRGRFGTGKSAAFGIADAIRVTTVRGGTRCVAELSKADVFARQDSDQIPVRLLEVSELTDQRNGTCIQIDGVSQRAIVIDDIRKYFERQLCYWCRNAHVFLNGQECVVPQPAIQFERRFVPDDATRSAIGEVELVVSVSKEYLEEYRRGVAISCNGVLHEVRQVDGNRYIFGSIDVPDIDRRTFEIPPFDSSRTLKLNQNNPLVAALFNFVDECTKQVCKECEELKREKQKNDEAKKLARLSSDVSKALNRHFEHLKTKPKQVRLAMGEFSAGRANLDNGGSARLLTRNGPICGEAVPFSARRIESTTGLPVGIGAEYPKVAPATYLAQTDAGSEKGHAEPGNPHEGQKGVGFTVRYENAGPTAHRATYAADEMAILINLDHPQLARAYKQWGVDSEAFQRLTQEIAFAEYSLGLMAELGQNNYFVTHFDLLDEIRETLNWLARATS